MLDAPHPRAQLALDNVEQFAHAIWTLQAIKSFMKIIFSRKGVDSAAGQCASAIVDGRPVSLPIPTSMPTVTRYGDLSEPIPAMAYDLSRGRLAYDQACHLDPDIGRHALRGTRPTGWRGALGQVSAALAHLRNMRVGPDDLFLFWGLFRSCERRSTGWNYVGPRRHVIFGWLQIDEVLDLGADGSKVLKRYPWLAQHPHARAGWTANNVIFIGREWYCYCLEDNHARVDLRDYF
jgi:Nucleotide modification associated domain 3